MVMLASNYDPALTGGQTTIITTPTQPLKILSPEMQLDRQGDSN